jgi:Tol biopolymer transport system component
MRALAPTVADTSAPRARRTLIPLLLAVALCGPSWAQLTERVSLPGGGGQGNHASTANASQYVVSADGRYIVFSSDASNLVQNDTNQTTDVFVRDRLTGTVELVSANPSAGVGNGASGNSPMAISGDGRYVAFDSDSSDLVPGDTNGQRDVFIRDRNLGTTQLVSVGLGGAPSDGYSYTGSMSRDGRFVVFPSLASNLVASDTNASWDVFVRDLQTGTTELASVSSNGVQGNDWSAGGSISGDGRYVAFQSVSTNLVSGDTNGTWDVFLRDRLSGITTVLSVDSGGNLGTGLSGVGAIATNGHFVVFQSSSPNLVPGDTNGTDDVFLRDLSAGTTELVSLSTSGGQGNGLSGSPFISDDGRFVGFMSYATNLVSGDTNGVADTFLHDCALGTTERISVSTTGVQGNAQSVGGWLTPDNRFAVFWSNATNLCAGDTNAARDVFLRDRFATGFTSLCDPGLNGVRACPCNNPPSGTGRGCDNSASTGGASLAASGIAYLSIDSLVFTATDERPNSTSVLVEGTAPASSGIVFGQGVRCLGGTLKRLYVKTAVNGSITAPDFAAGDMTVTARSAQMGVPIQAGQLCYFLVTYRDPVVMGGCPTSSTFNATQTGVVTYWP